MNEIDATASRAVDVFLARPANVLLALTESGFTPREAWRLYQFLPIAFFHVAMRGMGMTFQLGYDLEDRKTGAVARHQLDDEPLYLAGLRAAERLIAAGRRDDLGPVFSCSSEYDVLRQLWDGDPRGTVFCEPLLREFDDGDSNWFLG